MWDLIVSVLDHCLSFYFVRIRWFLGTATAEISSRKTSISIKFSSKSDEKYQSYGSFSTYCPISDTIFLFHF